MGTRERTGTGGGVISLVRVQEGMDFKEPGRMDFKPHARAEVILESNNIVIFKGLILGKI